MPNHVHLLVTADTNEGPSELLRHLSLRFVNAVNRRYRLTGTACNAFAAPSPLIEPHAEYLAPAALPHGAIFASSFVGFEAVQTQQ